MKRVSYIFPVSHRFRQPFHERLRVILAGEGVDYRVVYCTPPVENRQKGDTVDIEWGVKVSSSTLPGGLIYQHGLREALRSDLVIVQQENKLVLNYLLNLASMAGLRKVGYFGHGRNFQSRNPDGTAERWKRFWARRCDWWFAYTDQTRTHLEGLGFAPKRITVFNNAVDTSELSRLAVEIDGAEVRAALEGVGVQGNNMAIFVGGLYPDKRLEFLVAAADLVRSKVSDFELLVVGGGFDRPLLERLAATRPWVHVAGPRFGREKVALMKGAKLFLMPGLVGLAVLDAAALGLPVVTTNYPYHSPEIAYLEHGASGLIVEPFEDEAAYAAAVIGLLESPERMKKMSERSTEIAQNYTIDAMAERFSAGVLEALA